MIAVGSIVALRGSDRTVGEVDSIDGRTVLVSWPAVACQTARTDDRGRRCQAYDVAALERATEEHLVVFAGWRCRCTILAARLHDVGTYCPTHGAPLLGRPEWTQVGSGVLGVQAGDQ